MVYPHKWLPVSCTSSAGQGKFKDRRSTTAPRNQSITFKRNVIKLRQQDHGRIPNKSTKFHQKMFF